jgi:hypothetical protein
MEFWQVFATSSLVAAGVTIGVTRLLKQWDDDALRSATKQAIQAEIDYASEFAVDYLKPGSVKAPLHRITTAFYNEGVPKLIALRAINYECAQALLQYYGNIDQMNRSLDVLLSLRKPEEQQHKFEEIGRTFLKACSLVPIRELRRLGSLQREHEIEIRIIRKKSMKYGDCAPYDRVKRAMGLI